jgi:hypothetical protein
LTHYFVDFQAHQFFLRLNRATEGLVDKNLANKSHPKYLKDSLKPVGFKPKFKLDYISNYWRALALALTETGMSGGVEMLFSDITGSQYDLHSLALNGEIWDFGGQVTYLQQKKIYYVGRNAITQPLFLGQFIDSLDTSNNDIHQTRSTN